VSAAELVEKLFELGVHHVDEATDVVKRSVRYFRVFVDGRLIGYSEGRIVSYKHFKDYAQIWKDTSAYRNFSVLTEERKRYKEIAHQLQRWSSHETFGHRQGRQAHSVSGSRREDP
jgi:hypothetical protein